MIRTAWAWLLPVLLATTTAGADEPRPSPTPVRFVYERGPGAEQCPSPTALRAAVSARLGYEPFAASAPSTVAATISRRGRVLEARIELLDAAGSTTGSRTLTSSGGDCAELAAAAALAISIAVDPNAALRGASPAPRAQQSAPPRPKAPPRLMDPSPAEEPVRSAPARSERVSFRAGAEILAAFGAAPRPAFGVGLLAGVRWRAFSFAIEGRADVPVSMPAQAGGTVGAMLVVGTFAPCFHRSVMVGCALVSAGVLRGASDGISMPRSETTPLVLAGGRFGLEIPLFGGLSARGHVDLLGTITRTTLEIDGRPVWTTPILSGALGTGIVWSFP